MLDICWKDLSQEEKKRATDLRWNKAAWDADAGK